MPENQDNYSYEDLLKYLKMSKTALNNFNEFYPDLSFTRTHPKQVILTILKDVVKQYEDDLFAETAYLEPEEQKTIVIGSVYKFNHHKGYNKKEYSKQEKLVDKVKDRFIKDLNDIISIGQIKVTAQMLRLQNLTADFTSGRIDKRTWHEGWVQKQVAHYRNYHIKQAKKYSVSKKLNLEFAATTMDLPEKSGIYLLFKDGELIYIGHSGNLRNRLSNHDIVRKYYLPNDGNGYMMDCVYGIMPIEVAKKLEWKLIELAKPKDNVRGK